MMDPNETLQQLRKLITLWHNETGGTTEDSLERADRIVELFDGFDQWLSSGGFLPAAWVPEMGREAKQPEFHRTYDRRLDQM